MTKYPHRQQGFSLIELLLVLALIAALAVAAFVIYPRVQAGRSATYEASLINSAVATVKTLYGSRNYDSLTTTVAIDAQMFPEQMTVGTGLKNEWEGDVTVQPAAADASAATAAGTPDHYFKITYANVPSRVCVKMVPTMLRTFGTIVINTTTVQNTYSTTAPFEGDEASIAAACVDSPSVLLTFVSN